MIRKCKCIRPESTTCKYRYIDTGGVYEYTVVDSYDGFDMRFYLIKSYNPIKITPVPEKVFQIEFKILDRQEKLERILNQSF